VTREPRLPRRTRLLLGLGAVLFWVAQLGLLLVFGLPLPDTIMLAVLLVAMPALALAQLPLVGHEPIERLPAYWGSIGTLWLLGTACWLVGTRDGGPANVGVVWIPLGSLAAWSVGLTLAGLATMVLFRQIAVTGSGADDTLVRDLLPQSRRERGVFAVLSVAAGVGEEVAYRGYAVPSLATAFGVPGSVLLTSLVFGILHGYQGLLGTARTALIGGILACGLLGSGSLLPSIIAHTVIDLVAGLLLRERLLPPSSEIGRGPATAEHDPHSTETRESSS